MDPRGRQPPAIGDRIVERDEGLRVRDEVVEGLEVEQALLRGLSRRDAEPDHAAFRQVGNALGKKVEVGDGAAEKRRVVAQQVGRRAIELEQRLPHRHGVEL